MGLNTHGGGSYGPKGLSLGQRCMHTNFRFGGTPHKNHVVVALAGTNKRGTTLKTYHSLF